VVPPEMKKPKQLEDENARLKKIVADLTLDREMLQDVMRAGSTLPQMPRSFEGRTKPLMDEVMDLGLNKGEA
jgi:hypothetical protein